MQIILKISCILTLSIFFNFYTAAQIAIGTTANINQCEDIPNTNTIPNPDSKILTVVPFSVIMTNTSNQVIKIRIHNLNLTSGITGFNQDFTLQPEEEKIIFDMPSFSEIDANRINEFCIHYKISYQIQGNTTFNGTSISSPWKLINDKICISFCPHEEQEESDVTNNGTTITPNPFINSTQVSYFVPETSIVTIEIYNNFGIRERTIIRNSWHESGQYKTQFIGGRLEPGLYFVKIQIGNDIKTYPIIKQ